MKFKKIPITIEATQWFKNGDHPLDNSCPVLDTGHISEGEIIRYYIHPYVDGDSLCKHCKKEMHHHGWIDTPGGGHTVCPSDWIITGIGGEHYPCKDSIFRKTYEPMEVQSE